MTLIGGPTTGGFDDDEDEDDENEEQEVVDAVQLRQQLQRVARGEEVRTTISTLILCIDKVMTCFSAAR